MNLRDALISGSLHGADRLSVEADRRLRRRLGFEPVATPRRVWVWPALAAFAAAAVVIVIVLMNNPSSTKATPAVATAGSANTPTQTWRGAEITVTPGTEVAQHDDRLVLVRGAIEILRKDQKVMVVDVPMGHVVIASYHSRIIAERESFTILLDDGTGHYTSAAGETYPISPNVEFVWPRPAIAPPVPAPTPVKPPPGRAHVIPPNETQLRTEQTGPPGLTPPIIRPDTPCIFKSDCDPGATCRKNERGESVCMGNGGEGAACWFDNDCTSNLCVSRRCAP